MGTWLKDIIETLESLGGIAPLSEIYKSIEKFRTEPSPKRIKEIIRRTIVTYSSKSKKINSKDVFYSVEGLGSGIWGLHSFNKITPNAIDLNLPKGEKNPISVVQTTYRKLRDTNLSRTIKVLHKNKCQLCGKYIELNNGSRYSEGHHIKPLGKPHNGPDVAGNILILCPNHHVMLDYGVIELKDAEIKTIPGHEIEREYIDYHNKEVWNINY